MAHDLQLMRPLVTAARGSENSDKMPPGYPGGQDSADRLSMRTFVTDLAAKSSPEGHLSAFKRWLFAPARGCFAMRSRPLAVAIAFLVRARAHADPGRCLALPAVRAGGFGRWRLGRARTGTAGNRPQRCARLLRHHDFSRRLGVGNRQCCFVHADRSGHRLERRAAATQPYSSRHQHARDALAREAHLASILDTVPDAMIVIDERRHHAIVQLGRRAAVRLYRGGGALERTSSC